jgi:hypothetical protein
MGLTLIMRLGILDLHETFMPEISYVINVIKEITNAPRDV